MLQRISTIIEKELIQHLRDRRTLAVLILTPLLQLMLFGYAIHMTVTHIPLVVVDQSLDAQSRTYIEDLVSSQYFDIISWAASQDEAIKVIDEGEARTGVVIPPDFGSHVKRGDAQVLFLVDGSDMFTSQSAFNAANMVAQNHAIQLNLVETPTQGQQANNLSLAASVRVLYNPDMKDLWFMIPGMIAMLLQQECIILTAMAVVRERETGTLEQILVTPIRPIELMIGKALPNLIIAMINMLTILAVGVFWFKMPFQGNIWLFAALSILFALAGLGLGLLISSVSENQRQAQQLTMAISLIALILGGAFFPRYAMPRVIQWLGNLIPVTYFIPISRSIINKGVGLNYLWVNALALVIYVVGILYVAARTFHQRLE
jgi:drug efflux transport system permease protein